MRKSFIPFLRIQRVPEVETLQEIDHGYVRRVKRAALNISAVNARIHKRKLTMSGIRGSFALKQNQ